MADHHIALPNEAKHERKLRTIHVLARSLVQEHTIGTHSVELPVLVLVEGTYTHVADELPFGRVTRLLCCTRLFSLHHDL